MIDKERMYDRQNAYIKDHYARVNVVYTPPELDAIKAAAAERGQSVSAYIRQACAERIAREQPEQPEQITPDTP